MSSSCEANQLKARLGILYGKRFRTVCDCPADEEDHDHVEDHGRSENSSPRTGLSIHARLLHWQATIAYGREEPQGESCKARWEDKCVIDPCVHWLHDIGPSEGFPIVHDNLHATIGGFGNATAFGD
jgi:hypothetical protein